MQRPRDRLRRLRRRLRRLERREESALRRWIEDTDNLVHVSILLFVPLTIAAVTALANATPSLSFLLFPPLASGAFTLFADPEGKYASPLRFVAGLTTGAVCGWIALMLLGDPGSGSVDAAAAGLAVLLTGGATWLLDIEEPGGFSVALLLLVQDAPPGVYVLSVAVASAIVGGVYLTWHDTIYERRAEFLYATTGRDDDVLVPMVEGADPIARLGARIASGHEHGRLVLLGILDADGAEPDQAASGSIEDATSSDDAGAVTASEEPGPSAEEALVDRLEARATELADATGASCDIVVARGSNPSLVTRETAKEADSDLILAPFTGPDEDGFVTSLFASDLDVAAARVDRRRWLQLLVPIRSAGDLAHRKVDLARRIAGPAGRVTVANCIDSEADRRRAESMCANVVDAYEGRFETLVARTDIESFLADHASANDLIVLGASTDRSPASRLLSRPTYERVQDVDTDLLVVHAGRP